MRRDGERQGKIEPSANAHVEESERGVLEDRVVEHDRRGERQRGAHCTARPREHQAEREQADRQPQSRTPIAVVVERRGAEVEQGGGAEQPKAVCGNRRQPAESEREAGERVRHRREHVQRPEQVRGRLHAAGDEWCMGARIVDAGSRLVKRRRLTMNPRRLYPRSQWSRLDVAGGEGGVKPTSSPSPSWRWRWLALPTRRCGFRPTRAR